MLLIPNFTSASDAIAINPISSKLDTGNVLNSYLDSTKIDSLIIIRIDIFIKGFVPTAFKVTYPLEFMPPSIILALVYDVYSVEVMLLLGIICTIALLLILVIFQYFH